MEFKNIYCCLFRIHSFHKYPFLQYLFLGSTDVLDFIEIPVDKVPSFKENVQDHLVRFTSEYIQRIHGIKCLAFEEVYEHNDNLYFFFDITEHTSPTYGTTFAIIDEIVNHKKVCQFQICPHIVDLFTQHPSLLYVCNDQQQPYEIPVVAFAPTYNDFQYKFVDMFGKSPQDKTAIVGPYFYFTSFESALQSSPVGIVRFALFAGHTKMVENITPNFSDSNGEWTHEYDSIYIHSLPFETDQITPILAVKNYNQQVTLSSHRAKDTQTVILH